MSDLLTNQLISVLEELLEEGSVRLDLAACPWLLSAFFKHLSKDILVLVADDEEAKELAKKLSSFSIPSLHFPAFPAFPWEELYLPPQIRAQRNLVLEDLSQPGAHLIVASVSAALICFPREFRSQFKLKLQQEIELHSFLKEVEARGYERNYLVEREGDYSHRGSLVDLFPPNFERPIRVDFSFNQVQSIRTFDLSTQRSVEELAYILVPDLREAQLGAEERKQVKKLFKESGWSDEAGDLEAGKTFPGWGVYWPYLYSKLVTLDKLLAPSSWLFLLEPDRLKEEARRKLVFWEETFLEAVEKRSLTRPSEFPWQTMGEISCSSQVELVPQKGNLTSPLPALKNLEQVASLVNRWLSEGLKIVLVGEAVALKKFQVELHNYLKEGFEKVETMVGELDRGFIFKPLGTVFISLAEVLSPRREVKRQLSSIPHLPPLDLKVGDYVVHVNHGIGKYQGSERLQVGKSTRDYLIIEYADGLLKIPADQVGRLTRYYSSSETSPQVARLSSLEWTRQKERAKKSAQKLAIDLLKLYARREAVQSHAFSPDTPWQQELEESFVYEETPDQLRALQEVKQDMELSKPMDRLVFGDVGYGKTEIALRASFKAVLDGKQVMVLVPTTILAEQHFQTFFERLKPFPVKVELLSRFVPPPQQREIGLKFRHGAIDILIGTHRLLSSDICPKDLGLLIIDEEHRFGVAQKEKIKALEEGVDVLTLSATPIPRTLQMALSGIREVSVIETPPQARLPIATYVGPYDEEKVQLAIKRELARGGQVFYVYNSIEKLPRVVAKVRQFFPLAKVAMAHGQMNVDELELVMWEFIQSEYDILVATTIVEAGIDLPNVNTLIVEEAERLGLAQAYQLRGRVGRSNRQAYAYFFFNSHQLTSAGWERLKSLAELADLGSGLKLALKDLEIRGSGSLFGPQQHGHISAVGFDLYTQLVKEAVEDLKGVKPKKLRDVEISLPLAAFIPKDWLSEERLRLEFYHRLYLVQSLEELEDLKMEMIDRFGRLPSQAVNLLWAASARLKAGKAKIDVLRWRNGKLVIRAAEISQLYKQLKKFYPQAQRGFGEVWLPVASNEIKPFLDSLFDVIMQRV